MHVDYLLSLIDLGFEIVLQESFYHWETVHCDHAVSMHYGNARETLLLFLLGAYVIQAQL